MCKSITLVYKLCFYINTQQAPPTYGSRHVGNLLYNNTLYAYTIRVVITYTTIYALRLWLIGKPVVCFLFVIIELFSLAVTVETL